METDPAPVTAKGWSKRHQLWIKAYASRPVFGAEVLDGLQRAVLETLPGWSKELKVAKSADAKTAVDVGSRRLQDAVKEGARCREGLGSAVLRGADKSVRIYLDSWEETVPPELNLVSVEVDRTQMVEGKTPPEWAQGLFRALVEALPLRYANARLSDEFSSKNMVDDDSGLRALGTKLTESLPGLYWLNFLGPPYLKLLGLDNLLSAPAYIVDKVDSGVLLMLDRSPLSWDSPAYKEREKAVLEHVGRHYFFQRDDPDRERAAPKFARA